ncbi:MAG: hypothetical protein IGS39_26175 [Calothrix sp. C42_A2020_038]|nr:hypothetical protein [Calothrix sp. C42_A2020_038]
MITWSIGLLILVGWGLLIYTYRDQIQVWRQKVCVDIECAPLRKKLLKFVTRDTAERLIALARSKNPGKPERWYLEKVLYDLQRRR